MGTPPRHANPWARVHSALPGINMLISACDERECVEASPRIHIGRLLTDTDAYVFNYMKVVECQLHGKPVPKYNTHI